MRSLARAVAWFASGSFIGTLTQVVKGKLGAVVLGPEGFGVLSQLTNAWSLVFALSGLSFYNGLVQRVAALRALDDEPALLRQLSTSLVFLTAFSCLVAGVTTAASPWISDLIFADSGARARYVAIALLSVPFAVTAQTYRGLMSGCRLVRPIVFAQIVSDIVGVVVFALLLFYMGLLGAVIGFAALHIIKLMAQIATVNRALGSRFIVPDLSAFQWREVRVNLGFGLNGLLMSGLSIGTVLLVSRWVIGDLGLDANGIFSVAWKVASLYLGALYAAAGGYYFASLVSCRTEAELSTRINEAVRLYMYILPPVIVAIIIGGDVLITVLFSSEFGMAAVLLALMLPGDIFRVLAETTGLSFLAKRKLLFYTLAYLGWAGSFVVLVYYLLPLYGLLGVASAYLISQGINASIVLILAFKQFEFQLSSTTVITLASAILAISAAAYVAFVAHTRPAQAIAGIATLILWGTANWKVQEFRDFARAAWRRVGLQ